MPAFIEIEDLAHSYALPGGERIQALDGVTLSIQPGEYVAIVGANGSGKTTLARHLNALLLPDRGTVRVDGMDTRRPENRARIRVLVGMIMQSPEDQIVATGVEEDVAFGLENQGLPATEIQQQVKAALISVGMWEERLRPPYLLSAGQMQRVAIAGVLALKPGCIIFDEATAMLDPVGRQEVLQNMNRLHAEGVTILSITHFMENAALAERVIVLNQGRLVADASPAHVFSSTTNLQAWGLDLPLPARLAERLSKAGMNLPGRVFAFTDLVASLPPYAGLKSGRQVQAYPSNHKASNTKIIEVQHLGHVYLDGTPLEQRALFEANLSVTSGRVHGILGATGSGKSTLLQHLNGLLLPQEGTVRVGEFNLNAPKFDVSALRRKVGLVFQIPESQFFEQYAGDEIAFGPRMLVPGVDLRERVRWAMQSVGLDFERYKDRLVFTLSGGERRKVALASILAIQPQILLLDEPMAGMDPASRKDLLAKLIHLGQTGMTLVLSSHYMDDVAEVASEITVFHQGKDVIRGSAADVFSQQDQLTTLGLEIPVVYSVAERLRSLGWPLQPGILQVEDLITQVIQLVRINPA